MYRLFVYKFKSNYIENEPSVVEEGESIRELRDRAFEYLNELCYYTFIADEENLLEGIGKDKEVVRYLPSEYSTLMSGFIYRVCVELGLKDNHWYRFSGEEELKLEYENGNILIIKDIRRIEPLLNIFIRNIQEYTNGKGVSSIVFNPNILTGYDKLYISYTDDLKKENCVKVVIRK